MKEKKIPLWQIICVICVMAFIATLVILSLILSNEKWSFNAELVTLVSFIVIVCAGFFFDSVQIGKISLLKNEVKGKEAIISSLQKNSNDYEYQIKQDFAPAFNSGLLRIEQIAV